MNKYISKIKKWGDQDLVGDFVSSKSISAGIGSEYVKTGDTITRKHPLRDWYLDKKLNGLANHESRAHLSQDLMRYLLRAFM